MKFVRREANGAFDFTAYEAYLAHERDRLAALIDGTDVLAPERFSLSERGAFHDARLEALSAATSAGASALEVNLRLKGPYFDRFFELRYAGVVSLRLAAPGRERDLLVHELRLEHDLLAHEILFDGDHTLEIVCATLTFREILGRALPG